MFYSLKYNNIIFLKELKEYDKCLVEIDKLEQILNNKQGYEVKKIYILMLKANCLKEKKLYNLSIEVHEKILELCEDELELSLATFCNILEIYMELNDTKNISKYLDKCIFALKPYKDIENKVFSSDIYHDIALGYYTINQFSVSKEYFNAAMEEGRTFNNKKVITSCFRKLLDIAVKEKIDSDIQKLKNTLLQFISLEILSANDMVVFDFINYFNNINDSSTVSDIIKFIQKVYTKENNE